MNKTVVFDMDGLLFDTEALVLSCWKVVGEKYGLNGIEEVFRLCIGTNSSETRQIVCGNLGVICISQEGGRKWHSGEAGRERTSQFSESERLSDGTCDLDTKEDSRAGA